jgi:hypothetical protein
LTFRLKRQPGVYPFHYLWNEVSTYPRWKNKVFMETSFYYNRRSLARLNDQPSCALVGGERQKVGVKPPCALAPALVVAVAHTGSSAFQSSARTAAPIARWSCELARCIKSLTATQLVIQRDDGGKPEVHTRGQVAPLPFPQVVSKGTVFPADAEIVEGALNAVYSALRSRLDPAAKEQLKEEELRWLRTRETIKHNTHSHMIKGTVENLTEFTVLRIMMLKYQLANAER